jgi:hydroxymethylbilane synthase
MRLTIAARRSELARIQAYQVGDALARAHLHLELEYSFHESLGDRNQNDPLWQMPERGVFTQDFREGLLAGAFDLVVHSWKDLAIESDPLTEVAATLPRADMRDVLLVRSDRWAQVERTGVLRILTSSPRRAHNLKTFLPEALPAKIDELQFVAVRGNVPTRVRKLWQQDADGLIVAKAALDRLLGTERPEFALTRADMRQALEKCRFMVLPLRANPTAPGQGALAIEIKREREDLRSLLATINCADTFASVTRERAILGGYGGGCHQKIGASVLKRPYGEITFVRGLADDGTILDSESLCASQKTPAKVSREDLWPLKLSDAVWFDREPIPVQIPLTDTALWISKAEAFPPEANAATSQIIWASGLQTWRRLAQRGVWVNGSAEGLGEQERPGIETLAGGELNWLKLTHQQNFNGNGRDSVATYRLVTKDLNPNLEGKTHFFWNSGSSFERALALNPWIKTMTHYCGPGNTRQILETNGVQPFIVLDHAHWLKEIGQ